MALGKFRVGRILRLIAFMAAVALAALFVIPSLAGRNRRWRKGVTIARLRDQMAAFRSLDADWIRRWRRERGRTFSR